MKNIKQNQKLTAHGHCEHIYLFYLAYTQYSFNKWEISYKHLESWFLFQIYIWQHSVYIPAWPQ